MPHALKNIKSILPLSEYVFDKLQNSVAYIPPLLEILYLDLIIMIFNHKRNQFGIHLELNKIFHLQKSILFTEFCSIMISQANV